MAVYQRRGVQSGDRIWDALRVRALRQHLAMTQRQFAEELNARQQTVSEWETGRYRPRGPSARLLSLIAEAADYPYQAGPAGSRRAGPEAAPEPSAAAAAEAEAKSLAADDPSVPPAQPDGA